MLSLNVSASIRSTDARMPSARPSSTMITGLRSLSSMWIASLTGLSAASSGNGGSITSVTGSPRIPGSVGRGHEQTRAR